MFGLFNHTFGNLPISNPDSWKMLLNEPSKNNLSKEDMQKIKLYATEIGVLQTTIRNKIDNKSFQLSSNFNFFDNQSYTDHTRLQESKMLLNIIGMFLSILSVFSMFRNSLNKW